MQVVKCSGVALFSVAVWSVGWSAEGRAEEAPEAVRSLAVVDLPTAITAAQLDVRTELTSMGGVLSAGSEVEVGLGRGFAAAVAATMTEGQDRGQMERTGTVAGVVSYRWQRPRRISQLSLGYRQPLGSAVAGGVRSRAGIRSTGESWAAASLEVGFSDRLDGTVAAAVGVGRGPVVPALEVKVGRCVKTCAMGAFGVRVRLPSTFELGLAVVGEALPARQVGMAFSVGWSSGAPSGGLARGAE